MLPAEIVLSHQGEIGAMDAFMRRFEDRMIEYVTRQHSKQMTRDVSAAGKCQSLAELGCEMDRLIDFRRTRRRSRLPGSSKIYRIGAH
jgi:hypothetical protein